MVRCVRTSCGSSAPSATGACISIANSFYRYGAQAGQQTIDDARITSGMTRLTTRIGEKNKIAGYVDRIRKFRGHENSAPAITPSPVKPPTSARRSSISHERVQLTGTLTSKFLVEAGYFRDQQRATTTPLDLKSVPQLEQGGQTPTNPLFIPKRDVTLQTSFDQLRRRHLPRADPQDGGDLGHASPVRTTSRWACSTASATSGVSAAWRRSRPAAPGNGAPSQVIIYNTPQSSQSDMNADQGIYAQDQWTSAASRSTRARLRALQQGHRRPFGRGRPASFRARTFAQQDNVPNWNDISPRRLGFAWDVQGNGKDGGEGGLGQHARLRSRASLTRMTRTSSPRRPRAGPTSTATTSPRAAWPTTRTARVRRRASTAALVAKSTDSTLSSTFGTKPQQTFAPDIKRPFQ